MRTTGLDPIQLTEASTVSFMVKYLILWKKSVGFPKANA